MYIFYHFKEKTNYGINLSSQEKCQLDQLTFLDNFNEVYQIGNFKRGLLDHRHKNYALDH